MSEEAIWHYLLKGLDTIQIKTPGSVGLKLFSKKQSIYLIVHQDRDLHCFEVCFEEEKNVTLFSVSRGYASSGVVVAPFQSLATYDDRWCGPLETV